MIFVSLFHFFIRSLASSSVENSSVAETRPPSFTEKKNSEKCYKKSEQFYKENRLDLFQIRILPLKNDLDKIYTKKVLKFQAKDYCFSQITSCYELLIKIS